MLAHPRRVFFCALALAATLTGAQAQHGAPRIEDFRLDLPKDAIAAAENDNLRALASQAYLWGAPLFLSYRQTTEIKQARRMMAPNEEPFGGWVLMRNLATPADTNNVLPNVDTLYGASYVLLDRQGPVVLSLPKLKDRYYSVALHDAYFNTFAVVGSRSTGGDAADILILPPGHKGSVAGKFAQVIRAPTPSIALYQRIYVRDDADVPAVRALQDRIRLAPLAGWKSKDGNFPRIDTSEFDAPAPVRETRDPMRFFEIVNRQGCRNPPPQDYAALVDAFRAAGLGPCTKALPEGEAAKEAIAQGARQAQAVIDARISGGAVRNGWSVPDPNAGQTSPDYTGRAVVQIHQIGSLPPAEAMYFTARTDKAGSRLDGARAYALTFPADALPPVESGGFWSLTMYDAATNLLVANPLNRFIIRPSTPGLTKNADGSLTLNLAATQPAGTPLGNWLPAPSGGFIVVLRTYLPGEAIRSGRWFPPALELR